MPDFVSQNFGMLIGETMTCLTCHEKKSPKVLKHDSFILTLGKLYTKKKKLRRISHEKKTHLAKSFVTKKYLMIKFYEKTELIDFICDEFSKFFHKI